MSVRAFGPARGRLRAWPVLLLTLLVGCGPSERLFHDARYTTEGGEIELAALMPGCGCVTFASTLKTGEGDIEIVSRLQGAEVGSLILSPQKPERVRFDWAGSSNVERYRIAAYRRVPGPDGQMQRASEPLVPIGSYVFKSPIVESSCRDTLCAFGLLHMDQALHARIGQNEVDVRRRGVDYTSGGQQIQVSSSPPKCGCMAIQNVSGNKSPVTLQATLNGENRGTITLPWNAAVERQPLVLVGFDWGGAFEEDAYVLSVLRVANRTNEPTGQTSGTFNTQSSLRVQDYVSVVGQIDQLECSDEGSVMWLPSHAGPDLTAAEPAPGGATASPKAPKEVPVVCHFNTIRMNKMAPTVARTLKELGIPPTAADAPPAPPDAPGPATPPESAPGQKRIIR